MRGILAQYMILEDGNGDSDWMGDGSSSSGFQPMSEDGRVTGVWRPKGIIWLTTFSQYGTTIITTNNTNIFLKLMQSHFYAAWNVG